MRFRVTRTSAKYDGESPCHGATPGEVERWDIRTFKSAEQYDAKLGHEGRWTERGTDHQVIYGPGGETRGIKRKVDPEHGWFIDFDSLADLLAFHEEHGDLVIETDERSGSVPTIQIYDEWRE